MLRQWSQEKYAGEEIETKWAGYTWIRSQNLVSETLFEEKKRQWTPFIIVVVKQQDNIS
jgi:hypothetical protein